MFGPSGFWTMALLRYAAKFDPFLSLDCARVEGVGAQSKERKGSNFTIWQPRSLPLPSLSISPLSLHFTAVQQSRPMKRIPLFKGKFPHNFFLPQSSRREGEVREGEGKDKLLSLFAAVSVEIRRCSAAPLVSQFSCEERG